MLKGRVSSRWIGRDTWNEMLERDILGGLGRPSMSMAFLILPLKSIIPPTLAAAIEAIAPCMDSYRGRQAASSVQNQESGTESLA